MKTLNELSKAEKKKLIVESLKKHDSGLKMRQKEGKLYYRSENTAIMAREKRFYNVARKMMQRDYTKANNRLPSGFMGLIVKQKVAYSVNNKIVVDEKLFDKIEKEKFQKRLKATATDASNQVYGVWQFWVKGNDLLYKRLNPMSVIPIFDDMEEDKVAIVIKSYEEGGVKVVELWDGQAYETWHFKKDKGRNRQWCYIGTEAHYQGNTMTNGKVINTEDHSWGRPPFAFMFNNDELQTDLEKVKNYIDLYDIVASDFGNNLEDFQELYWVLKGYQGQDPEQFIQEFKRSRVLKVGEGGDARQEAQEVPYDARNACLDLLRHDIYRFGMGVDPEAIKGDTTNVAIKATFYNLNLKANDFEAEIQDFINQVVYFVNEYYGKADYESIKFNRDLLFNTKDTVEELVKLKGTLSDETILKLLPYDIDVAAELELIEKQRAKEMAELETPFEG